ncbi:MAG: 50S ribosomal protein L1 [Fervidicoccaceae archaeon]
MLVTTDLVESIRSSLQALLSDRSRRNFRESIELIVTFKKTELKPEEMKWRETLYLPHPPAKEVKVCVAAEGETAIRAREAGAYLVLDRGALEELSGNKKKARKIAETCDWVLVQRELMPLVGRTLGPALGPRGKAPAPLPAGASIASTLDLFRRAVNLKMKEQPHVQVRIGTVDNSIEELVANASAVLEKIGEKMGGKTIKKIYLKRTMGPVVEIGAGAGQRR